MLEYVKQHIDITSEDLKSEVILKQKDSTYFLLLNRKANTFTHSFIRSIEAALDEVENSDGAACLVTISLDPKMFSGGLDLKMTSNLEHIQDIRYFILEFIAMLGRFAALNVPSIAVVKGAAIAGGCMLTFAHDFIYVVEKGVFGCNEIDIGLPLPPGMFEVIKRKHSSPLTLRDMTLFGRRFTHEEALESKLIDGIENLDSIIKKAEGLARYGANRENFKKIKMEENKVVIDACFNKQHAVGTIGQIKLPVFPKL